MAWHGSWPGGFVAGAFSPPSEGPFSSPHLIFSFSNLSLPVRGRLQSFFLPCASTPILHCVLYCRPCLHLSICLLHDGDAPRRITNEPQRIAGAQRPMRWKIGNNKRRMRLVRDTNRTRRRS